MFDIENSFNNNQIPYKKLDGNENYVIYKVKSKKMLLCLKGRKNRFELERDVFDYLDMNKLDYSLLLVDGNNLFFIELNKKNNWIKSCFESCDKDSIFLGKQVLNHRVREEELANLLS